MFAHGTPNDIQFITPWIQTAPFVLPLIFLASAEAYFRPSRHYQDSTRLALFAGGALVLVSTLLILLFCLPAQAMVIWQMPELRTLMITSQVIYGSAAVWLVFAWLLYRWMPVPWMPPALMQHLGLLAIYTSLDSMEFLLKNMRLFPTTHLPLLLCCSYVVLFYFWLRIPLEGFTSKQPPPSSKAEIEAAKQAVKTVSRMVEKEQ